MRQRPREAAGTRTSWRPRRKCAIYPRNVILARLGGASSGGDNSGRVHLPRIQGEIAAAIKPDGGARVAWPGSRSPPRHVSAGAGNRCCAFRLHTHAHIRPRRNACFAARPHRRSGCPPGENTRRGRCLRRARSLAERLQPLSSSKVAVFGVRGAFGGGERAIGWNFAEPFRTRDLVRSHRSASPQCTRVANP